VNFHPHVHGNWGRVHFSAIGICNFIESRVTRLVAYRQNNSPPPGLLPGTSVLVSWEADAVRLLPEL